MKTFLYWFSVVFSIILVITVNLIFDFRIGVVWEFLICLLVVIAPSIILNILDWLVPKNLYMQDKKIYNERKFESTLFKKLKIKKWKDNVPQFLKIKNINKIKEENKQVDADYINFFIIETRRGELMHLLDIILGIIAMLFLPRHYFLRYSLPIILVWIFFNGLSIIIQRYNRPRLKKFLSRIEQNKNINQQLTDEENLKTEF